MNNYAFMIGFTNVFDNSLVVITMAVETWSNGQLLNSNPISIGECLDNFPGTHVSN